jgi:hypothetical protein
VPGRTRFCSGGRGVFFYLFILKKNYALVLGLCLTGQGSAQAVEVFFLEIFFFREKREKN